MTQSEWQTPPLGSVPPSAPEGRSFEAGGRLVFWALVCAAVWFVLSVAIAAVGLGINDDGDSEAAQLALVIGQLAGGVLGWMVLPVWIVRRMGRGDLIRWRRPERQDIRLALSGLAAIYVALLVYRGIVSLLGADGLVPESTIDDEALYEYTSVVVVLGILVIGAAPFYEEAFARGLLLGGLRWRWGRCRRLRLVRSCLRRCMRMWGA